MLAAIQVASVQLSKGRNLQPPFITGAQSHKVERRTEKCTFGLFSFPAPLMQLCHRDWKICGNISDIFSWGIIFVQKRRGSITEFLPKSNRESNWHVAGLILQYEMPIPVALRSSPFLLPLYDSVKKEERLKKEHSDAEISPGILSVSFHRQLLKSCCTFMQTEN